MPGKIGIWLFLASEIMFFVGILGTYIIYRSGAPRLFAKQGEALSKSLAGLNTLVLIFSSLTMAIAVDAAQKGDRKRLLGGLALTILCAATFMGIKAIEYADKFRHHTIVSAADAEVTVKAAPGQTLYATVTNPTRQVFNATSKAFQPSSAAARRWNEVVIKLEPKGEPGTYAGTVPAGAAGPNKINVYKTTAEGAQPTSKDKTITPASVDYGGGVFVFDGHVHDHGAEYAFTGWRAPYPKDTGADIHMLSEADVRALPGAKEVGTKEWPQTIEKARINADTNYGPWKNNFFASYF